MRRFNNPPLGHPDPDGVKLKTIRAELARTLRQRFLEETTDILVFDDWMSCPQWPRTDAENVVFRQAMGIMNDVYVHCDCVMHIHADLPAPPYDPSTRLPSLPTVLGPANQTLPSDRGWVYLERFTTMLKVATARTSFALFVVSIRRIFIVAMQPHQPRPPAFRHRRRPGTATSTSW